MKVVQLSGSLRASVGKKETKAVRANGNVPCVLYGSGEQFCFSVRSVDLEKLIFSPNVYQIELDLDGTKKMAIIQAKQMHPITDKPMHVDFLELADDKPVKIGIPIRVTGRSKGVLNGGRLMTIFRTLKVEGLPKDLPNEVEIDITPLRIGQSIRVRDIDMPGVKTLENESAVVVSVKMSRGAVDTDDDEEEEGAEEAAESTED
ncbi:50S ribosomal protein L25 [Brumimicrobium mesophilum]|uniref:50S ribosomal protein L25 n=1 Tax=Brumimicrobium mesophilum TaxID=392717 RepID=UPI000D13F267|nr:50S ribosomal protein L25 [Brumimicrobium mesophilum]